MYHLSWLKTMMPQDCFHFIILFSCPFLPKSPGSSYLKLLNSSLVVLYIFLTLHSSHSSQTLRNIVCFVLWKGKCRRNRYIQNYLLPYPYQKVKKELGDCRTHEGKRYLIAIVIIITKIEKIQVLLIIESQ